MLRSRVFLGALVVLCTGLLALPAAADRYHVLPEGLRTSGPSVPGDWSAANCYPTLAAAAAAAGAADSVVCAEGDHVVSTAVTLEVAWLGNRFFSVDPADARLDLGDTGQLAPDTGLAELRVQGLTMQGGTSQRAIPALAAVGQTLALEGCDITGFHTQNDGANGGAALRLTGGGSLVATDCRFTGNTSVGRGGAVFLGANQAAEFTRCLLRDNTSGGVSDPRGGAVFIDARTAISAATFRACEFRDNTSGGPGGAVSMLSASATYEDCLIVGNRSGQENGWSEGAGLHHRRNIGDHLASVQTEARRCHFENNKGATDVELNGGDGGAFYASGAQGPLFIGVTVEDCEFVDNYNLQGAGVYTSAFTYGAVRRCRFVDNIAYFMGGAVFRGGRFSANAGETLYIDQCLFVRNLAGFDAAGVPTDDYCRGGAICCRMRPRVIVRHGTFIDNRVSDSAYRFGDAFAHYYEVGLWEPDMLCELRNCAFWGEGGVHVQAYSSPDGMAAAQHLAAAAGELDLGGIALVSPVELTASPFTDLDSGQPLLQGGLVDAGIELGFTSDIDGNPMPRGLAPDIGCLEVQPSTPVDDLPAPSAAFTAAPNPFNPRTVLEARLAARADVRVLLLDPRGRRVRVLQSGRLPAGVHRWTWDGRDQTGRECAAGVYLAHLVIDGRAAGLRKLALVR